jgi:hypothetical protein
LQSSQLELDLRTALLGLYKNYLPAPLSQSGAGIKRLTNWPQLSRLAKDTFTPEESTALTFLYNTYTCTVFLQHILQFYFIASSFKLLVHLFWLLQRHKMDTTQKVPLLLKFLQFSTPLLL